MQKLHKGKLVDIVIYADDKLIMQKLHRNGLIYAKFA